MEIKEFAKYMKDKLDNRLGEEYTVQLHEKLRINHIIEHGLMVQKKNSNTAPSFSMEPYYADYLNHIPLGQLEDQLYHDYLQSAESSIPMNLLNNYSSVCKQIFMKLVHPSKNQGILETVPHIPYLDLTAVFYIRLDELCDHSVCITNIILNFWNVSVEDLKAQSLENMKNESVELRQISANGLISEFGVINDTLENMSQSAANHTIIYNLSNKIRYWGSATLLIPNLLSMIAKINGSDLIILPKSMHDVFIIPFLSKTNPKYISLATYISGLLDQSLVDGQKLSDNVYLYHMDSQKISIYSSAEKIVMIEE